MPNKKAKQRKYDKKKRKEAIKKFKRDKKTLRVMIREKEKYIESS